ncbi:hypothetical protein NQ315_007435 [Exocentrus adspersus]|uniref:C2H2-type domain-containing protein n=1 Tax=Exocentrus adspersus TaxID=1586481 RepID=A0AAV8VHM4_9CUCU|nr:hypothetical protein NQ315_007435 [Exocentrus adspersus]
MKCKMDKRLMRKLGKPSRYMFCGKPRLCAICCITFRENYFEKIVKITREVLSVLSIQINLKKNGLVMCKSCSNKVKVLFDFKAACLYTEDFITPFVDEEAKNRIELKELFLKEKGYDGELAFILCNKSLCRLCMGLADVGCLCLEGRDPHVNFVKDRIKKCIPEVNVDNTRDAVVCDACVESLKDYSDFLDLCLRLKKNNDFQIKTEEIQIETLECNLLEDSQKVFNESDQFKYRTESTQDELHSNVLKLNECDDKASIFPVPVELLEDGLKYCKPQQINLKTRRNQDQLRKRYKCHLCDYKAKHQCDLKRHMLVHKHSSEIEWLKCPLCDHKTKRKENLKGHMLVHKHPAETKWFSCHLCTYRANKKYVLTAHMLVHKDPTEIKWFKCDLCNYKSKTNGNLRRHTLVHKDLSQMEVKWLKCDECEYRSRYRFSLAKHIEAHKDPSEIAWLRCDSCGFKAKVKSHLKSHIMLVHRDSAEVEWFKCNLCNFKSKYGNSLRNHLSVHKDPTEVKWFVCGLCGFTTKQKGNLKRHMRTIHKIINILKL